MAGKIYTKTGDEGYTKTMAGEKLAKNDAVIIANGKIDSLQASLDAARLQCVQDKSLADKIDWVQEKLWQSGGEVSLGRTGGIVKNPVTQKDVEKLEGWIDGYCEGKEFRQFVRFRSAEAIVLNESRVRCREAETALLPLLGKRITSETFRFFNRLGDFIYAASCDCEGAGK